MSGRSDEEIIDAMLVSYGYHNRRALVAAGRAEGDTQGERRGWIEALKWAAQLASDVAPSGVALRIEDRIRARLREIEGEG